MNKHVKESLLLSNSLVLVREVKRAGYGYARRGINALAIATLAWGFIVAVLLAVHLVGAAVADIQRNDVKERIREAVLKTVDCLTNPNTPPTACIEQVTE